MTVSPVRVPSPAAIGLAGFALGVLLGCGSGPRVAPTAAVLVLIATLAGRHHRAALIGWVLLAGIGHGWLARSVDRGRCAARYRDGPLAVQVRIDEPAPPGQLASASVIGASCSGSIEMRARRGDTLWAGDVVRLQGQWRARIGGWRPANGLLLVSEAADVRHAPGLVDRLRNRLHRDSDRLYGSRSGVVKALILGRRGTIETSMAQSFSRSGLVHLLSISGFHVGLVWLWVRLVLRLIGINRRAQAIAAVAVVGYVAFVGADPPAVRAAVLAIVTAIERSRQRNPAVGSLFAAVGLSVLLVNPWAVTDLGAWLSASALWGATAATRWSDRAVSPAPGWRVIAGSTGATIATAPFTAFAFGTIPVAGIVLNIVAIPLTALAVPAVVASLVVAPWSTSVASAFAGGGGALLAVLELLADRGGEVPFGAVTVEPGVSAALWAAVAIGTAAWAFGHRHTAREAGHRLLWLGAAGAALHGLLVVIPRIHTGSRLTLHFLDVGQGDAALVETPHGHWVLIDAGPADERTDAGRRVIVPYLRSHGVGRLDAAILSHGHRDHFGGLVSVLRAVTVEKIFEPARRIDDAGYLALLDTIADRGIAWYPLRAGGRLVVDGVELDAIHPDSAWAGWGEDLNEDSAVLRLTAGSFAALFSGDAGLAAEAAMAGRAGRVDLLKVGHHGSRGATGSSWLEALGPKAAVVSVGVNRYGHPAPETLGRLEAKRIPLWRTDREGTVTVTVDEETMRIRGRRTDATFPIN